MSIVQPGGLVLITGANGYVASVTVKHLLDRGYKVRGAVRSVDKCASLAEFFGPNFSLVEVPEMGAEGAYDEAVREVDGVIHMAANMNFDPTDVSVIPQATNAILSVLKASAKEPSIQRVVLTSSQNACLTNCPNVKYEINKETWNTAAEEEAKQEWDGKEPALRGMLLYNAAKTQSERAAWAWVAESKPHYVFNTLVTASNFGKHVAPQQLGYRSSCALMETFARGTLAVSALLPAQQCVNISDTVLMHEAALTLDQVQGERLFSFGSGYCWRRILEIINRRFPELKKADSLVEDGDDFGTVDMARSKEVIRLMGKDDFSTLEETIVEAVEGFKESWKLEGVPKNVFDDLLAPTA